MRLFWQIIVLSAILLETGKSISSSITLFFLLLFGRFLSSRGLAFYVTSRPFLLNFMNGMTCWFCLVFPSLLPAARVPTGTRLHWLGCVWWVCRSFSQLSPPVRTFNVFYGPNRLNKEILITFSLLVTLRRSASVVDCCYSTFLVSLSNSYFAMTLDSFKLSSFSFGPTTTRRRRRESEEGSRPRLPPQLPQNNSRDYYYYY